jgi:thymidylate synthase
MHACQTHTPALPTDATPEHNRVMTRARTIDVDTIGAAWLEVARAILADGWRSTYDSLAITEIARVTLEVAHPDANDEVIALYADTDRLEWMRGNFVDHDRVAALGDARSYASRLYDYGESGANQLDWVVDRLRSDPLSRSATITTFEPLSDTTYIPCVSMLDFWIPRVDSDPSAAVDLVVYAHSIDFGAKGYANLIQLAELQTQVATRLEREAGALTMIVKSAHIYDTDLAYMSGVLARAGVSG